MTGHPIWTLVIINVSAFGLGWEVRGRLLNASIKATAKLFLHLNNGRAWSVPSLVRATGLSTFRVRLTLTQLENAGKARHAWVDSPPFGGQMLWRATTEPLPPKTGRYQYVDGIIRDTRKPPTD